MNDLNGLLHVFTCIAQCCLQGKVHFSGTFKHGESTNTKIVLIFILSSDFFLNIPRRRHESISMHLVTDLLLPSFTSLLDVLKFPTLNSGTSDSATSPIWTSIADLLLIVHPTYVLWGNRKEFLHWNQSKWKSTLSSLSSLTITVNTSRLPLLSIHFSSIPLHPFRRLSIHTL